MRKQSKSCLKNTRLNGQNIGKKIDEKKSANVPKSSPKMIVEMVEKKKLSETLITKQAKER